MRRMSSCPFAPAGPLIDAAILAAMAAAAEVAASGLAAGEPEPAAAVDGDCEAAPGSSHLRLRSAESMAMSDALEWNRRR